MIQSPASVAPSLSGIPGGIEAESIKFTVDAALLRELGERLVGQPHVALAELIKNSYDADAHDVVVEFGPGRITVRDDGHGMTRPEFEAFWMRVGTPHKQEERASRNLGRPLTGSKGVGRLAVQFLARRIELRTVPAAQPDRLLVARVDWDEAVRAAELTEATAKLWEEPANGHPPGTTITLEGLRDEWDDARLEGVAREIWWLMPPFHADPRLSAEARAAFNVRLEGPDAEARKTFEDQVKAYLDIWLAKLVGKVVDDPTNAGRRLVRLVLDFRDGARVLHEYPLDAGFLRALEFEIRVYDLQYRQRFGIRVEEARKYVRDFGGVHVYDAGFHLPHYGPDTDWLDIDRDHARRLSASDLLPKELQVPGGLEYLPPSHRLFGQVHVNTSQERFQALSTGASARDCLTIQVTRDRLADNAAYRTLKNAVRYALDFYAHQEMKRVAARNQATQPVDPIPPTLEELGNVLEAYRDEMPLHVYKAVSQGVDHIVEARTAEANAMVARVGLLGSLATAGMAAIAYEHEVSKRLLSLDDAITDLRSLTVPGQAERDRLDGVIRRMGESLSALRGMRSLFLPLTDEENRTRRARFRASALLRQVCEHMGVLLQGIPLDVSAIDPALRLPPATFAEWTAVFQNVIVNAANAMLDSPTRRIAAYSRARGRSRCVVIQDTGCGVDLSTAEKLFEPFERRLEISAERRALGMGGTGLGLTIVRMIAQHAGCRVAFVVPEPPYRTAFQLEWRETE